MTAVVCGICGGSGAGKTTLTRHLVDQVGSDRISVLSFDAYYRDLTHLEVAERARCNFDHPSSLDHEMFCEHLDRLRHGQDIEVPEYDFVNHTMTDRTTTLEARATVIVEGILLYAFPEIIELIDVSVFLDIPAEIRLARRIERDVVERGRDPDDVRRQFADTVAPMHDLFVQPHRDIADRVVRVGEPYDVVAGELAEDLVLRSATSPVT